MNKNTKIAKEKMLKKVNDYENELLNNIDKLDEKIINQCDDITIRTNLEGNKYKGVILYITILGAYLEIDTSDHYSPTIKADGTDYDLEIANISVVKELNQKLADKIDNIFENYFYK